MSSRAAANATVPEEEETEAAVEVHGSRRCYRKVVMVEEWKYDTMETCNHSYDKVGGGRVGGELSIIICNCSEVPHELRDPVRGAPAGGVQGAVRQGLPHQD